MTTLRDRLLGGMLGLLVADALGVPYEFKPPDRIPDQVTMTPPSGYPVAHQVPPGTWSDDGSQALLLLDSLLDRDRLDPDDLGRRLVEWRAGAYWIDRTVFDCGVATGTAIGRLSRGVPALEAGPSGERDNGNGSLMRLLPLALWHSGTDAELVTDAALQSRLTHGHATSRVCCEVYAVWARRLLTGLDPAAALEDALATYGTIRPPGTDEDAELAGAIQPLVTDQLNGSGYVVHSLRSACTLLTRPDATYENVVRRAIALGEDTDTTACIAGGVAGVAFGVEAIPADWLAALRGRDICDPIIDRLVAARG